MSPRCPAGFAAARRSSISTTRRISTAETDANFVITGSGGLVEIQATAEAAVFSPDELAALLALAQKGVAELVALQKAALA